MAATKFKLSSVHGDIKLKKKKRRRKKETLSMLSEECQPSAAPVDSSQALPGMSCTDVSKRKKPIAARNGWSASSLCDEVSSEEEKLSLLAWVEKGMHPSVDERSTNGFKSRSRIGPHDERPGGAASQNPNGVNVSQDQNLCIVQQRQTVRCHSEQLLSGNYSFQRDSLTENKEIIDSASLNPCYDATIDSSGDEIHSSLTAHGSIPNSNKRKRQVDKVLEYVNRRCIVIKSSSGSLIGKCRTSHSVVSAWGRSIHVTLTSEACTVEDWISSHDGHLFGLDVEWRPNRIKGQRNKVALLQLSDEKECLIVQVLFLDKQPQALRQLLSDPSKGLAGVGVLADGKRLLQDYGFECKGGIELTALAVERLKREELRNVGLKVLVQEVLGLSLQKSKRVTLSNWANERLDESQINYACMDAWASFALAKELL